MATGVIDVADVDIGCDNVVKTSVGESEARFISCSFDSRDIANGATCGCDCSGGKDKC